MKFKVSPRLKLPCMPGPGAGWYWIFTEKILGCSQPEAKERKLITIEVCGVTAEPFKPSSTMAASREIAELVVDEDAADVILFQQCLDGRSRARAPHWDVDQVRSAVGGDHHIGLGRVLAEQAVAGLRVGVVRNRRVLGVGI